MDEEDHKLAEDEARRVKQHEDVKSKIRTDVNAKIERTAEHIAADDQGDVKTAARGLKEKAVREIASTESELSRARTVARISQVIDYLFYVLYGLIGLQIVLELLGAREKSGFKQILNAITMPFLAIFKGIMPDPSVGSFQLMASYMVALVVYFLLHLAIRGFLRIFVHRKSTV